jgi:hypothetical protein
LLCRTAGSWLVVVYVLVSEGSDTKGRVAVGEDGTATTTDRTARAVYRKADGRLAEVGWDRLLVNEAADGLPVREFRW